MAKADTHDRLEQLDEQILALLNERCRLVRRTADRGPADPHPPATRRRRLQRLQHRNPGPLPAAAVEAVFREIWSGTAPPDRRLTVAFFGPPATFTHQAALATFGATARYLEQPTITDVFDAVTRGEARYGIVPVENSTEGCVTHTLDMFVDTDLLICAETSLPVHHCLLAPTARTALRTLFSHPQVFGQCRRWLHRNLPDVHLVEVSSTTEAARRCRTEPHAGALAGELAAQAYKLTIRERNIEDATENTTRFIVLGKESPPPSGDDKTSLLLAIRHRVGALYDSLLPFGRHGVNLTFIESRPSKRRNWEYYFFIDFIGHVSDPRAKAVLDELAGHCQFVKLLGSYPRAAEAP